MNSLAGLAALNALFLLAGGSLLWGIRGLSAWSELVRLAGVAYLLGTAASVLVLTQLLIVGIDLSVPLIIGVAGTLILAGIVAGRKRQRPALRLPPAQEPFALVGVLLASLVALNLAIVFRVARTQGLTAWDAWAFWTQKAQAIYHSGGLDEQLFTTLPGPSYPIFIPTLEGTAFAFMGSADTVTLHVQFWLLAVGFLAAVAGLLRPTVPLAVIWPFLALTLLMPEFDYRLLAPFADATLGYLFVLAALCLALWLVRREGWLLASSGIFLAAAMATKREGQILAGALVLAAMLAATDRRRTLPRILGVAAAAWALTIPWRIWRGAHELPGEGPGTAPAAYWEQLSRIHRSLWHVVELFFDYDLWTIPAPVAVAAAVLVLLVRRLAKVYARLFLATVVFTILGFTWILWSIPGLPLDVTDQSPIPRAVGTLELLAIAFAPLLCWQLMTAGRQREPRGARPPG